MKTNSGGAVVRIFEANFRSSTIDRGGLSYEAPIPRRRERRGHSLAEPRVIVGNEVILHRPDRGVEHWRAPIVRDSREASGSDWPGAEAR